MLNLLHVSGVKAALLAVGVTASAALPPAAPVPHAMMRTATKKAILLQMDRRLGVIERTQQTMLRGYETGGISR